MSSPVFSDSIYRYLLELDLLSVFEGGGGGAEGSPTMLLTLLRCFNMAQKHFIGE